jgi:hypothetical protein
MQNDKQILEDQGATATRKALIISVSDYSFTSNLQSLDFCKNHEEKMSEILISNMKYRTWINPSSSSILYSEWRNVGYDFYD